MLRRWINELFDLAFGLETSRTGFSLNEKIGRINARVTLLLANNAKHERCIATLQKEKKADKKALSLAMKPNTAPNLAIAPQLAQKSDANTISLDNSRYEKLCEKLKATQLQLEAENAKEERAATTSRLEIEILRKA
ncbi:uncharacterized protein RCO7_03710 [Rhynchosporium graminicola]|uniref:Uncharacterized protein n=1 Tax=Rhynchosporium graminicola TaxID=2792576 RepID=A0A1E1LGE7_9HELO|nr:uncharacterized protein RCO7_03710 [Rhynchosporium commune]